MLRSLLKYSTIVERYWYWGRQMLASQVMPTKPELTPELVMKMLTSTFRSVMEVRIRFLKILFQIITWLTLRVQL